MSTLQALQHIINEPVQKLAPEGRSLKAAGDFVDVYLKDPEVREMLKELLVNSPSNCDKVSLF